MRRDRYAFVLTAFVSAALAITMAVAASAQSEKIIHSFVGSDGAQPLAALVFDSKGNLYGTTVIGGNDNGCICGTVFQLTPSANGTWTEKVLYNFGSASPLDGVAPDGSLIFDAKGNLYGTTQAALGGQGTVFELSPGSGGTWTEKVLYTFTGGADGGSPVGGLVFDSLGNLYGTTNLGGAFGWGRSLNSSRDQAERGPRRFCIASRVGMTAVPHSAVH